MKMKKILGVCSALVFMLTGSFTAYGYEQDIESNDILESMIIDNEDEFTEFPYDLMSDNIKIYGENNISTYSDDNTFDDNIYIDNDSVIIVFKKEFSELNKVWNVSDFNCSNIESIEDLTYLNFDQEEKNEYLSQVTFRQILKLNLKETGKDKIAEVMEVISERDDIKCIYPNMYFQIDKEPEVSETYNSSSLTSDKDRVNNLSSQASTLVPNDPETPSDYWVFKNTQLYEAWGTYTTGSSDVKVGIIDTGIKRLEDITPNLATGYNAFDNNTITDVHCYEHGTWVSSVLGAKGNNNIGVTGVNWNVSIVPLQVSSDTQMLHFEAVLKCLAYANIKKIPIVNMSISTNSDEIEKNVFLSDSISDYYGLVVCSAGNNGLNNDDIEKYPANCKSKNIICVGAVNENDDLTYYSNYGKNVDLAAPGNIKVAEINGSYNVEMGTSIAAPFVSGVAALILAYKPDLTTMQLKEAILNSVDKKSSLTGKVATGGRINAYKALKYVEESDYRQIVCQVSNGNSNISEFEDFIFYPSDQMTYKGYKTWNTLLANSLEITNYYVNTNNDSCIGISYKGKNIAANSKLYNLMFEMNLSEYEGTGSPLSVLLNYNVLGCNGTVYFAMLGDVNNDGNITNADVTLISKYTMNTFSPTNQQKVAMDVNIDGVIDFYDVLAVQNYINGTISSF